MRQALRYTQGYERSRMAILITAVLLLAFAPFALSDTSLFQPVKPVYVLSFTASDAGKITVKFGQKGKEVILKEIMPMSTAIIFVGGPEDWYGFTVGSMPNIYQAMNTLMRQ